MFTYKKDGMLVPAKIWMTEEEYYADEDMVTQIENLAKLPFAFNHIALSPDGHVGYGMPIGGVLATKGVVVPNAVGLDIGCGVCTVKTSITQIGTDTLKKIMGRIREEIPVGFNHHQFVKKEAIPYLPQYPISECYSTAGSVGRIDDPGNKMYHGIVPMLPVISREFSGLIYQLGTLGGGNHFIEIQKGSDGHIWIMIHSGSRNLGKQVADYYNKLAIKLNNKWHSSVPPEYGLAFLPLDSQEGKNYMHEMNYCVEFAFANRKLMMDRICEIFKEVLKNGVIEHLPIDESELDDDFEDFLPSDICDISFEPMINIAHNYAVIEHHFGSDVVVHRKGATLAREGTIGLIPGSQGTKSYVVKGKGNPESFNSCSHGAGRKMSRKKAIAELDLAAEQKLLDDQGILHAIRGKQDLEEAAGAYKDVTTVMANQTDLVDILVELTPLGVIK